MHLYIFSALMTLFALSVSNFIGAILLIVFSFPAFDADFFSIIYLLSFLFFFLLFLRPWFDMIARCSTLIEFSQTKKTPYIGFELKDALLIFNFIRNKPILLLLIITLLLTIANKVISKKEPFVKEVD